MAGMVLAGSMLTLSGVSIVYFRVPFSGLVVLSADLSALVTVLWVIGMANAVNLVDGLDGLAAGIVAIAAGAFFIYTVQLAGRDLLRPDNPSPADRRRRWWASASASCPTTSTRPGRSWATAAPCSWAC